MEVSVCDYGSTDTKWDDTALFDAKVYDQLFMMIYHLDCVVDRHVGQHKAGAHRARCSQGILRRSDRARFRHLGHRRPCDRQT